MAERRKHAFFGSLNICFSGNHAVARRKADQWVEQVLTHMSTPTRMFTKAGYIAVMAPEGHKGIILDEPKGWRLWFLSPNGKECAISYAGGSRNADEVWKQHLKHFDDWVVAELAEPRDGPNPMDLYLVVVEGDVDPSIEGPFPDDEARLATARRLREQSEDGVYRLDVTTGAKVAVDCFSGGEIDGDAETIAAERSRITLAAWEDKFSRMSIFAPKSADRIMPGITTGDEGYAELYHLSDYRVGSVSGGSVRLVPTTPQAADRSPVNYKGPLNLLTVTSDGTKLPIKPGDVIRNGGGVNATLIPVGARVRHETGVDRRQHDDVVILKCGQKVLGDIGWMGHSSNMLVVSMPSE